MDKIHVGLYGGKSIFGGKEIPLEAHIIYCDKHDECSFYKSGKCMRVRGFLVPQNCGFGNSSTVRGYTSREKKYYRFRSSYENDEVYGKLKYPSNDNIGIIGDNVILKLPYINLKFNEKLNKYYFDSLGISREITSIPISDFNVILLNDICSHTPRGLLGGVIDKYQEKTIPDFLIQLKRLMPDLYSKFIKAYPKYDKEPNYVGKKAYVNSLKPGTKFKKDKNEWLWDGEYVSTEKFDIGLSSPWWRDSVSEIIKIKVTDKMMFEITDNSIVDENTRFE